MVLHIYRPHHGSPVTKQFPYGFHGGPGLGVFGHIVFYPFAGIEDGGMILALEAVPEGGIGFMKLVSAEVHGNLPGNDDPLGTAVSQKLFLLHAVVLAYRVDNEIYGELLSAFNGNLVLQRFPGKGQGNRFLFNMREGDQLVEGPFQLTDIGIDVAGNVVHHILGQSDAHFSARFCRMIQQIS